MCMEHGNAKSEDKPDLRHCLKWFDGCSKCSGFQGKLQGCPEKYCAPEEPESSALRT